MGGIGAEVFFISLGLFVRSEGEAFFLVRRAKACQYRSAPNPDFWFRGFRIFPASNALEKEVRALIRRWISKSTSQSARWTTWNGGALPRSESGIP